MWGMFVPSPGKWGTEHGGWVQDSEREFLTWYLFLIFQKLGARRLAVARSRNGPVW